MNRSKWTPEQVERARKLIRSGLSRADTAQQMGVGYDALRGMCYRYRIFVPDKRRTWTKANVAKLRKLFLSGKSLTEIAAEFNLSRGAIHQAADRHGVERRKYEQVTESEVKLVAELRDTQKLTFGQIGIKLGWTANKARYTYTYHVRRATNRDANGFRRNARPTREVHTL